MKIKFWLTLLLLFFIKITSSQTKDEQQKKIKAEVAKTIYAPLKSSSRNGEGPMALPYLRNTVLGSAFVFNSQQPDLFVCGNTRSSDLYLFRWLRNNKHGVPVFGNPIPIKSFFTERGTLFQNDDVIHGLWLEKDSLYHTIFNRLNLSFEVREKIKLPELPGSVKSIATLTNKDGTVELILEIQGFRTASKYKNQNTSSENWRPYDEAGISSAGISYSYLYKVEYPELLSGVPRGIQKVSSTDREVLYRMINMTPVNLRKGHNNDLVTGSFLGIFTFYTKNEIGEEFFSERKYIVDNDGNIIRHPSVSASVCAYPDLKNGLTNIISGGEGAVYFYQFTGKFSQDGSPIFNEPTPVLQENADLYAGTLPVPSEVDWDGDGILDLVVGNSEGFVLFFRNIGTNSNPSFLPGKRIAAGGKAIQIQAEYSGSVQGTQESRWGYVSPTVIDWTGDGLPDIVMGDITGNYSIFINRGTKKNPLLDAARPLYCDGLQLHGMWRSRAAVGNIGGKKALAIVDGEDQFHLFWKLDDYNVKDGGKLLMPDGSTILTSAEPAGGTGRCKLDFFDYDGDGKLDLIIGNGRRSAIPNMQTGYPLPVLGEVTLGTPLFMKNVGTDTVPVFDHPAPFYLEGAGLLQPGGSHESGAIGTKLGGGNQRNLIVGNEVGQLYLLQGNKLKLMNMEEAKNYRNKPNPLGETISSENIIAIINDTSKNEKRLPTKANVHYGNHERQVLDFYKAKSDKPTPLVFWIHGGGWTSGDKRNVPDLERYLNAGISVVSINYRYTWQAENAFIEPPVKWPLDDAVRALQFVKSKAKEWNIDKRLIAASGSSAGGTSSLYLAFHNDLANPKSKDPIARESSRVNCAAVRHPQTTLDPQQMIEWTPNSTYGGHAFGFTNSSDVKLRDAFFNKFLAKRDSVMHWIKTYSPYELVSEEDPDVYLFYPSGAPSIGKPQKDPTHTSNFGLKLKEHCDKLGVQCEFVYAGLSNAIHVSIADYLIWKLTSTTQIKK